MIISLDAEKAFDKVQHPGVGWIGSFGLIDANLHLEWISNETLLYSTGNYI